MRFRVKTSPAKTINLAGGQAYQLDPKLELVSLVLTSFFNETFYEQSGERLQRLQMLIPAIDDMQFLAKAALYARTTFGMRTVSHVILAEVAQRTQGQAWVKYALADGMKRPDDILEIVGYYMMQHQDCSYRKGLPANMRKGIQLALEKFDTHQLAKYRGTRSSVKLVDILNLVHPKPTAKTHELFASLIQGTLKSHNTWETKLTQAGQQGETHEEVAELKSTAWRELIVEKKLGYLALLKNLRNIIQQAPEVLDEALAQLINREKIKKSLVLPFRFLRAIHEIEKLTEHGAQKTLAALTYAIELSLDNVPCLPGSTLVALDVSGSMQGNPLENGSLFAAVLARRNDADIMLFSTEARYFDYNPSDSVLATAKNIQAQADFGGTNFHAIFNRACRRYDRIIILSDMQGWIGHDTPQESFNNYKERLHATPRIFSFDLTGYGMIEFPQPEVYCIAGFSPKVFDIMELHERDKTALMSTIEAISLREF